MPNPFNLFSLTSVAVGLVAALGFVAFLWPIPVEAVGPLAFAGFLVPAGVFEIIKRAMTRKGPAAPPESRG